MTVVDKHHIGRKIEGIRILKGIKQETLANGLGMSQSAVSRLEQSDSIDEEKLANIASILGVSVQAIRNFSEEAAINFIADTINNHDQSASVFYSPSFNPIDKLLDMVEENKQLYERMLETERSKVKLLEDLLKSKV